MKRENVKKAIRLYEDIANIDFVLTEHKTRNWIKVIFNKGIRVISPDCKDVFYSERFQNELAEWLEQKRKQYQDELDAM